MANSTTAESVRAGILAFLSEDVVCDVLEDGTNRIGCVTPLEYPDGDSVVVWVRELGGKFEVSDYGEGFTGQVTRSSRDQKGLSESANHIAHAFGINVFEGRLGTQCSLKELGENIWRVANASSTIAQAIASSRPQRRKETEESEFVRLVDQTLRERNVPIEREHKLTGTSGHSHRATIFISNTHSIIEPVAGHWNQVASVYTKFSDLAPVNGFQRYSLLDDRLENPGEDVRSLLVQVSDVLSWSRHDNWLDQIK